MLQRLSANESRKLDALRKAHTECVEYHERLQVIAEQAIAFDLDDGVVVNYAKFGDVLAKNKVNDGKTILEEIGDKMNK